MSLNQKIDQYFVDSSLVPLMVHENYLKCRANTPREVLALNGAKANFMDLCAAAADSISLSDRVDSLIHGSNQEWSLAPLHAAMTSVIPAYYVHGAMGGRMDFAGWLGQNSKTGKHQRLLTDLTKHVFLHTQAGRAELRLDYFSLFAKALVSPMTLAGADGIDKVISFMDAYSISREDVDNVLDICLNPNFNAAAFTKIPTAVRSVFTRRYNQGVHRLPYSIGGPSSSAVKRINIEIETGGGAEDDDVILADDEPAEDNDELGKDKMIKAKVKKSAAGVKRGGGAAGGTAAKRGRGGKTK